MLQKTITSLRTDDSKFRLYLVDNNSQDNTKSLAIKFLDDGLVDAFINVIDKCMFSQAVKIAITEIRKRPVLPDIILISGDDYEYKNCWCKVLTRWFSGVGDDVSICCLDMEPDFPWNAVLGVKDSNMCRALVRASVPGANWSMRYKDWLFIEPLWNAGAYSKTFDLQTCDFLVQTKRPPCALDLCEHIGANSSTVGNLSYKLYGKPLDKVRYNLVPFSSR
jgi:glycosyltransferase involved in cell wall biosynthesis